MSAGALDTANWSLKEAIREHWSKRAASFDEAFGHCIPPGPVFDAWVGELARHLGDGPLDVLELASRTGEVTRVLLWLGHRVTGVDFSEAMIARARLKHGGEPRARFLLGDAERLLEPDDAYDAVVCRHLVWTLTDPEAALREWARVLKPGGRLVVFDGDFVRLPWQGRLALRAVRALERWAREPPHADPSLAAEHATILAALPFREGLRPGNLARLAREAGFGETSAFGYGPLARAQRSVASALEWLRTWTYDRFVLVARKPPR